jgi:hypothetical protein
MAYRTAITSIDGCEDRRLVCLLSGMKHGPGEEPPVAHPFRHAAADRRILSCDDQMARRPALSSLFYAAAGRARGDV